MAGQALGCKENLIWRQFGENYLERNNEKTTLLLSFYVKMV